MAGELVSNILLADGSNLLQADGASVILLVDQAAPEPPAQTVRGGGYPLPRRIKRETYWPRGRTLRELFEVAPRVTAEIPEPQPAEAAAPAPAEAASVQRETVAPDLSPLIEGINALRAAIDAAALVQAIEEDDAEVLMVVE